MKIIRNLIGQGIIILMFLPINAAACWIDIPLSKRIQTQPVVVIGRIIEIETAPKSDYSYDTASIEIERVLKNTDEDEIIRVDKIFPLAMPSINNTSHISTDIRYKNGQYGVWILNKHKGKYWATYPKDFQNIELAPEIAQIIQRQKQNSRKALNGTKGANLLQYLLSR